MFEYIQALHDTVDVDGLQSFVVGQVAGIVLHRHVLDEGVAKGGA